MKLRLQVGEGACTTVKCFNYELRRIDVLPPRDLNLGRGFTKSSS